MNLFHKLFSLCGARALVLTALLVVSANVKIAASETPSVQFTTVDTAVCDLNTITLKFALAGLPNYGRLFVIYRDPSGSEHPRETSVVNIKRNQLEVPITNEEYVASEESGHSAFKFKIVRAYVSNSDKVEDQIPVSIGERDSMVWHIYATPRQDLPPSDPHSIAIYNKEVNCGRDLELQANPRWQENSVYTWSVTGDAFSVENNGGPTAMMRYAKAGEFVKSSTTVRLTQVVGGMCKSSMSMSVTMLGEPDATLARKDANGDDIPLLICSSIDAEADSRDFDGSITLDGEAPFVAKLSSGQVYANLPSGTFTFTGARTDVAEPVTLAEVTDSHGCAATANYLHGKIEVIDRRPSPQLLADSVFSDNKTVQVSVIPTSDAHTFQWGVVPTSRKLDTSVNGYNDQADIVSRLNGTFAYYVVETDEAAGYAACPSDTMVFTATFDTPLRYPNGFSPNGDGRNDYLIIEGLPEHNHVTVTDARGKIVFDKADYRNDWDAEGLPDGYYVYIFKGEGTKTVKETLAIKRQSND